MRRVAKGGKLWLFHSRRDATSAASSRRPQRAHQHPLATRNPSARNVAIPESAFAPWGSKDVTPAITQQRRVQNAVMRQLAQQVLWAGTVLTDKQHETVTHFMKLRTDSRYRNARKMLVVTGVNLMQELNERGMHPKTLMICEGKEIPDWANSKTEIVVAKESVMEHACPGNDGYIGDFIVPEAPDVAELLANKRKLRNVLVLDNVFDEGLLGTSLRTAAAFAYDAVFLTNNCADLYSHKVTRASQGVVFQRTTPIYVVREEDGDDASGLLNVVIERNNLNVLAFSSHAPQQELLPRDTAATPAPKPQPVPLHEYCLNFYNDKSEGRCDGHVLISGPDIKGNLLRRIERTIVRPVTTLLLETPAMDFDVALPVLTHELRRGAQQEYMPELERMEPSTVSLQTKFATVEIGRSVPDISSKTINHDEDEQIEMATQVMEGKRARRLLMKTELSDDDAWLLHEERKIDRIRRQEEADAVDSLREKNRWFDQEEQFPGHLPHLVHDVNITVADRDVVRAEAKWAQNYKRSSNYENIYRKKERPIPSRYERRVPASFDSV